MAKFWSDLLFWVEVALLIAATTLMVWRRLYREFPFLYAYFSAVIVAAIVRWSFLLRVSVLSNQYFYAYWISEAFTVLMAFVVLYEIFLIRMFPSFHTTPIARYLLPSLVLLALVLAGVVFVLAPHHAPNMLSALVGATTLALNVLQVAVLLFFSVVLVVWGGGWEEHEFGIALGFGIYAISKLVTAAVRARAGYAPTAIDQLPTIGYFVALVVWTIYLSREYKPPEVNIPVGLVEMAQSWEKLLREIMGRRR